VRTHALNAIAIEAGAGSPELALVARAQGGDAAAFDRLIRPRLERLLRLAISTMGNESDARDVVQDSCLRAWRELPRLRDRDAFDAWLARIVVNGCRSAMRRRRRVTVREIPIEGLPAGSEPASTARRVGDELSATDAIRRAFDRLDGDRRLILVLHHVEERPISEIAALLGIPEGTAKWRLHKARLDLARALEVEER
jgi:RNA polymerase sigma-70 factor (ECF subfamily)